MKARFRFLTVVTALFAGFGLLSGCQKETLTHENYGKLQARVSTEADVKAALGEPTYKLNNMWIFERPDEHRFVKVEFEGGKVSRLEWIDGEQWKDTNDPQGGTHYKVSDK